MTEYYGPTSTAVHHFTAASVRPFVLSTCLFVTFLAHPQIAHGKGSAVSKTQATAWYLSICSMW